MRKKSAIMLSIMLVVGGLSILPMSGSGEGAYPHLFQAYDETTGTPMINNATDLTHPNDGLARMYNTMYPYEVVNTSNMQNWWYWNNTWDIVGVAGKSVKNNSFHLDTAGFDTNWTAGEIFIFTVEKDKNPGPVPMIYQLGTVPNGYVASASIAITVEDFQVVGPMDLEWIPAPFFPGPPGGEVIDWTPIGASVPNIDKYVVYESDNDDGPWVPRDWVVAPPAAYAPISGKWYSIGINWTGDIPSLVQGQPNPFNTAPDLNWTGELGFVTDGVSPDTGPENCRVFEFRVNYTDLNNDPPNASGVKLHIFDGAIETIYPMLEVNPLDAFYADGKLYYYTTQLAPPAVGYSYNFSASDQWNISGGGFATILQTGPSVVPNALPTISITTPNGGEFWTGSTWHAIFLTILDADDQVSPEFNMTLWLNYSTDGGLTFPNLITPVVGTIGKPTVLGIYPWFVAPENSITVKIRAEIRDSCGAAATDDSDNVFEIDSTAPTAELTDPLPSATDVPIGTNIEITFTDLPTPGMDTASAQAAFTLLKVSDWTLIGGNFLPWDVEKKVMTFDPTPDLEQYTDYQVNVTIAAHDDSDPGNNLTALYTATFTTEDKEPPEIVHTPVTAAETGALIPISANVTDNVGVHSVLLNYTNTAGATGNIPMTRTTGDTFEVDIPAQTVAGIVTYNIWANDSSGNQNETQSFIIQVTEKECYITGKVTDQDGNPVEGVTVEVFDDGTLLGSATTDSNGEFNITGLKCGTYELIITKPDYDTLEKDIDTNTVDQGTLKLTPTGVFPWWILIVLVVIIIIIILLLVLLKRRKKPEEEEEAPPEEVEEEAPEEEVVEEEVAEEEEDLGLEELEDISEEEKEGGE